MVSLVKKPLVGKFTINDLYIDKSSLCGVMVTPDFFDLVPSDILAVNVTGREWFDKTYGCKKRDLLTFKDVNKWGCKSLLKLAEESV